MSRSASAPSTIFNWPSARQSSINPRRSRMVVLLLGLMKKVSLLDAGALVTVEAEKNFSVLFRDSIALDAVACAVQSFPGFEIESEGVLATADHLVPDIAFF